MELNHKNLSIVKFKRDVETLLEKYAHLPQIRCAWIDWIFPQGYSEQCRVYKTNEIWMLEFLRERRGSVEQFFEGMTPLCKVQDGSRIIQGQSKFGAIRELGPNVQGWYTPEIWEWVKNNLHTNDPNTALR
jgi:hypothetical protein